MDDTRLVADGLPAIDVAARLGVVAAPTAVLIRPDGYVAWTGSGTDEG